MSDESKAAIDKSTWGMGPWQTEPDRVEWKHAGLPCLMVRVETHGAWCGYAAVPPGHPLHGKGYDDDGVDISAHGGLTYANKCAGHICHVPAPGEPDDVWWFGFDCVHYGDLAPAHRYRDGEYRTAEYVKAEVERVAEQLAEVQS